MGLATQDYSESLFQVSLGEMGPGDVVGELVFDGCQTSAYTVVTTSCVTVGEIQGEELEGRPPTELLHYNITACRV